MQCRRKPPPSRWLAPVPVIDKHVSAFCADHNVKEFAVNGDDHLGFVVKNFAAWVCEGRDDRFEVGDLHNQRSMSVRCLPKFGIGLRIRFGRGWNLATGVPRSSTVRSGGKKSSSPLTNMRCS